MVSLAVAPHPLLDLRAFVTTLPADAPRESPDWLTSELAPERGVGVTDEVRARVRDLLRHGGYKPTGRGKPASEYLLRGAPRIHLLVDLCNAVSLASGLPCSVVDLDRLTEPLSVTIAQEGAKYVFNAAGQEIDLKGLLCLCDATGPAANAVKDSQRSKTSVATTRGLCLVWGANALGDLAARTEARYRELTARVGGACHDVALAAG